MKAALPTKHLPPPGNLHPSVTWGESPPGADRNVTLFVAHSGVTIALPRSTAKVVLGRSSAATSEYRVDLSIAGAQDAGVSRRHAELAIQPDRVTIADLSSRNGTFLNARQLQPNVPAIVRNGDELRLGDLVARVYYVPRSSV